MDVQRSWPRPLAPQVPAAARASQAALVIAPSRPADPFPPAAHTAGQEAAVWPGIKQGDLLRVVQPIEDAAVLTLRWAAKVCLPLVAASVLGASSAAASQRLPCQHRT